MFRNHNSFDRHEISSSGDYVYIHRAKIQHAYEIARKHMSSVVKRSKEIYDPKIAFKRYKEGDSMCCLTETRKVGVMPKLRFTYEGHFSLKRNYHK